MTNASAKDCLNDKEVAEEFLKLFKSQYRGIQQVRVENGKVSVYSTIKSAKSLLGISRDLASAGFVRHEITRPDCLNTAVLTCHKSA